jgi:hypothetical protein
MSLTNGFTMNGKNITPIAYGIIMMGDPGTLTNSYNCTSITGGGTTIAIIQITNMPPNNVLVPIGSMVNGASSPSLCLSIYQTSTGSSTITIKINGGILSSM